jgi:hypothetical protein
MTVENETEGNEGVFDPEPSNRVGVAAITASEVAIATG